MSEFNLIFIGVVIIQSILFSILILFSDRNYLSNGIDNKDLLKEKNENR